MVLMLISHAIGYTWNGVWDTKSVIMNSYKIVIEKWHLFLEIMYLTKVFMWIRLFSSLMMLFKLWKAKKEMYWYGKVLFNSILYYAKKFNDWFVFRRHIYVPVIYNDICKKVTNVISSWHYLFELTKLILKTVQTMLIISTKSYYWSNWTDVLLIVLYN